MLFSYNLYYGTFLFIKLIYVHIIDYLFISTFIYIYTSAHNINLFTISSNNSLPFILDIYFTSIFCNDSCNFLKIFLHIQFPLTNFFVKFISKD